MQQRTIAGYAQMHGLAIEQRFVERGVSGSKPLADRPQGAALLAVLKPGDVVITPKLDRMFRSALDALDVLAKMKAAGISLHMIDLGGDTTGNGVSKLVFTILSAVAEAERDRTRERITEVQARPAAAVGGIWAARVPFGWKLGEDGDLVPVPEQQRAIETMRRLRAKGLALRAISDKLKAGGHVDQPPGGEEGAAAAARRAAS